MSGIDWGSTDTVLASQLVIATALAVHLLILRPRAARADLLLDAQIIQDELELAVRLGNVTEVSVEIVATQQLLRRVQQNPRSAGLVLERIPALAQTARQGPRPTDVEYLSGALDRLSDAGQRYLRGAWPRAGALPPPIAVATAVRETDEPIRDQANVHLEDDDDFVEEFGDEYDEDAPEQSPTVRGTERGVDLELHQDLDPDPDPEHDSELDGDEPAWTAIDEQVRRASRDAFSPTPATVDLSEPEWTPAWMDLVLAESSPRTSDSGQSDRHARPFRPSRSSNHSSARKSERLDRSTVLPR
jgi:hypothetical protein